MKNILQSIRRWDMQQFDLDKLKDKFIEDRNQDIELLQQVSKVKDNDELQEVLEMLVNVNIKKANKLDQLKQDIKNVEMSEAERRKTTKDLEYEKQINELKEQLDLYYSQNEEIQMKVHENVQIQGRYEQIIAEKERLKNIIVNQEEQLGQRQRQFMQSESQLQQLRCELEQLQHAFMDAQQEYYRNQQEQQAKYVSPSKYQKYQISKGQVPTVQEVEEDRELEASQRDSRVYQRDSRVDPRDSMAAQRDSMAAQRDYRADQRDSRADPRDSRADPRDSRAAQRDF